MSGAPPPLLVALAIVAAAAIVSALAILAMWPLLLRHALAKPNPRSSHETPTPQGGGIGVIAGVLATTSVALSALGLWDGFTLALVLAATFALLVVGILDDLYSLPVLIRVAVQLAAAVAVVMALPHDLRVVPALPLILERAIIVLALAWFVNLVNFMDGLDWMTVAEMVPLSVGLAAAGYSGALPASAVVVALALLGGVVGFAPFNRPVARLFLGDAGSLPVGLVSGWLLVLLAAGGHLAAALLLPLYYVADATLTLARRWRNGERRLWQAHRTHFYQRATKNGLSVNAVVSRVFLLNVLLAALACASIFIDHAVFDIAALMAGAVFVSLLLRRFAQPIPSIIARS